MSTVFPPEFVFVPTVALLSVTVVFEKLLALKLPPTTRSESVAGRALDRSGHVDRRHISGCGPVLVGVGGDRRRG